MIENGNRLIPNIDETEFVADGWVKVVGHPQPPVVGDPFQPLEELQKAPVAEEALRQASDPDRPDADEQGNKLEGLELHKRKINKKPRATQVALGERRSSQRPKRALGALWGT